MADAGRPRWDRDSETRASSEEVTATFALLGDETRLNILLAIWEEQVPLGDDNAVPFSRIFERVEYDDRGSFSYHLDRLKGRFVTQHGRRGGYELTIPGLKLVRSIVAGTGIEDSTLEPTGIDQPCPLCGATTEILYRDGVMFHRCTECQGMAPGKADVDRVLLGNYFEPAGIEDRNPEELHAASIVATIERARTLFNRLCPTCSGPVEGRLECCPDHDRSDGCERCGQRFGAWAHFECRVCKHYAVPDPRWLALFHPAVTSFYDDHGVSTRARADDFERARRVYGHVYDGDLDVVSVDPPRVTVTASIDEDVVRLAFDETASVVDVHRG